MLVVGEAGVGKSRLISAGVGVAEPAEVRVLRGGCLGLSGGLPFLPFLDVVRAVGDLDQGEVVEAALARCPPFVTGELARLMPQLGDGSEPMAPAESDTGGGASGCSRRCDVCSPRWRRSTRSRS